MKYLPQTLFVLSAAGVLFALGLLSGVYQWFPYAMAKAAYDSAKLVYQEFDMITGAKPVDHLFPSRHDGDGLVSLDRERMSPGLTLITSFFDGGLEVRLLAEDGTVVNRWPVSVSALWDNFDHIEPPSDRPRTDWNNLFNGIVLEPDGSIVFPLRGLVKLDRCGKVVWKLPLMSHHSVEKSPRGTYWVPNRRYVVGERPYRPLRQRYFVDSITEISADGKLLREFDILDVLYRNGMLPELFANNRMYRTGSENDVVHLNDVEEIPTRMLGAFPQFAAGDLLVSIREPNMVLVMDPDTLQVKWSQTGPWIQQHDADWQPDGTITVFDNRFDGTESGRVLGGSNIIAVDPATGEVRYLYGDEPGQYFYTAVQGDQQVLDNGDLLITESNAGRVFEVTPDGDIVWEYINRYSDDEVVRVPDGQRYSRDQLTVTDWTCG